MDILSIGRIPVYRNYYLEQIPEESDRKVPESITVIILYGRYSVI
jgi:hypothetical protein